MEGFLPAGHAAAWTAASAPFVVLGLRSIAKKVTNEPENKMLLGVSGAFTFVLSALKMPSVAGSSSHQADFRGSDERAQDLVGELSPGYTPWFRAPFKAPSADVEVVIFALQAAIGAGFIGYYVVTSRGSKRYGGSSDDD